MMNPHRFRKFRILMPLFFVGIAALLAWAVLRLWNGILPEVLGVKAIGYWQALGILVLAKILFGGFPGRGRGAFGPAGRFMMKERWESLTPEQRDELREGMRRRFGEWPRPPWHGEAEGAPKDQPANR